MYQNTRRLEHQNTPGPSYLYVRLSLLEFLQFVVWGSWYVTLGTYLLQTLQFTGREVGFVYGATAIAATVTPFFLGILADRVFSTEKLLAFLHLAGGITMFLTSFLKEFIFFYPALILYTFLYMPTFALTSALCLHHVESPARDYPRVRVWGTVGWILVGIIVGSLKWEPLVFPMWLSAASSLALGLYCFTLPNTPPQSGNKRPSFKDLVGWDLLRLFRHRSFAVLMISLTLIRLPSSFYYSFVNPFLNEIGIVNAAGKMSIGQATEIIVMLLLPWILGRFKIKWVIGTGLLLWGGRYALFALGMQPGYIWALYIAILVHGVAYNFSTLSAQIYVDSQVPGHLRSTAQGFITFITMGMGAFIGAYLAGEVVTAYTLPSGLHDWQPIWMIPAGIGLVVALVFLVFFKNEERKER